LPLLRRLNEAFCAHVDLLEAGIRARSRRRAVLRVASLPPPTSSSSYGTLAAERAGTLAAQGLRSCRAVRGHHAGGEDRASDTGAIWLHVHGQTRQRSDLSLPAAAARIHRSTIGFNRKKRSAPACR